MGNRRWLMMAVVLAWGIYAGRAEGYIEVTMEPLANKVAVADCVVVGKIVGVREKTVSVRPYPALDFKLDFKVFEVEVSEALMGVEEKTRKVEAGFWVQHLTMGSQKPAPEVGQVGVFLGVKQRDEGFYVVPAGWFIESKAEGYAKTLAAVKKRTELLKDPVKGMKSEKLGERLLAACLDVLRNTYRPYRLYGGKAKCEQMGEEESTLILTVLAEWGETDKDTGASVLNAVTWMQTAVRLGGGEWPKDFPQGALTDEKVVVEVRKWLKEHAASWRVQRLVGKEK